MSLPNQPGGPWSGYAETGEHPLTGYGVLIGIFSALFAGFLASLKITGRSLPERNRVGDVALLSVATYRLSRLISNDSVTSFIRAPFTEFVKPTGSGEVEEKPRGRGMRHAVGEMLTCPFCIGQWVAAFFAYGLVLAPRLTRFTAGLFTTYAIADWLQMINDAAKKRLENTSQGGRS